MAGPSSTAPNDARVTVTHVVADPTWSLRPWSVDVALGPVRAIIPAQPAADWLGILMPEPLDLFNIVPGMCDDDVEREVTDLLLSNRLDVQDIRRASLAVIGTVSGRPWWFALRLIKTAVASWEIIGGEMAMRGVDAERLSLSGWLDAVLYLSLRALDSTKATLFMSQLENPPPEAIADDPQAASSMEMTVDEFLALAAR